MERDRHTLAILIISIIAIVLITLNSLSNEFFARFVGISVVFGPGMGISYGLENPAFQPVRHLTNLFIINIASIALIYAVLSILPLQKRFENKILDKAMSHVRGSKEGMEKTMNTVAKNFEKHFGDIGFFMALALITFAYGPYVAAAIAFFISVRLNRAVIAIAIGSLVSLVFWWYLALGAIPFVTPTLIFVVVTGASILLFAYGWIRENRILEKIGEDVEYRRERLIEKRKEVQKGLRKRVNQARNNFKKRRDRRLKQLDEMVDKFR